MSFPEWDCKQEQKDKYAAHLRKCAGEIAACKDSDFRKSLINNLSSFLRGCGYEDDVIGPLYNSIMLFHEREDTDGMQASIINFAANIQVMDLPQKRKASNQINISNNNAQSAMFNISIVKDSLSQELSSEQINQLIGLIKTKKRGDVKAWLSNLGNNTLSGILSSILTSVIGL